MGCGRGAAADRAGEDHLFRRRADDEPRADEASRPRQIRSVDADRHRRRRRAAPGRPRRAARGELPRRPAGARLRPDRDQCRRLRQFLVQLSRQAGLDRAGAAALSSSSPYSARATAICRRASAARSRIRSAANIRGYWRNAAATAAAFTADGYLRTGDIGYLDEDGYLFIVDRKKDIIIRGGENISAPEVEAAIYACPASPRRPCSASPDERLGEVPVAVIHARDGSELDEAEIARIPRGATRRVQDSGAYDLLRRAPAAARHRQDRPRRAEGTARQLNCTAHRPPHLADRRRRRHRPGRRLRALAARARQRTSRAGQASRLFGHYPQDRPGRAGDGRRAAGRDRAGHLDRAAADRSPTSWARRGRRSRSSPRRLRRSMPIHWRTGGLARGFRPLRAAPVERRRRGSPPGRPRSAPSRAAARGRRRWRARC